MPVVHDPWVGSQYRASTQRLLLLGDSHYLSPGDVDTPALTVEQVEQARAGTPSSNFFSRAADLAGGPAARTAGGREAFWDRVLFLNFAPVVVGAVPEAKPTREMFEQGRERFFRLLDDPDTRPTHVLSLGQRQWNQIPDHDRRKRASGELPDRWISEPGRVPAQPQIRRWVREDCVIAATWVNHPSRRFSIDRWRLRVHELLEQPGGCD